MEPNTCPLCGSAGLVEKPLLLLPDRFAIFVAGEFVKLTPHQFIILSVLNDRRPHPVAHEVLYNALYEGALDPPFEAVMKTHICRIRNHLKNTGLKISTVWGFGYRLEIGE